MGLERTEVSGLLQPHYNRTSMQALHLYVYIHTYTYAWLWLKNLKSKLFVACAQVSAQLFTDTISILRSQEVSASAVLHMLY